jgi:hypothetical protein
MRKAILCFPLLAAACSGGGDAREKNPDDAGGTAPVQAETAAPAPAAQQSGPEAPTAPETEREAEAAAGVVRTWFDHVEEGRFAEARRLWSDGAAGRKLAGRLARHAEVHVELGAPGRVEGAAGSLYVEVPVRIWGHSQGGEAFDCRGGARLRRASEVPGATPDQLQWRIFAIDLRNEPHQCRPDGEPE